MPETLPITPKKAKNRRQYHSTFTRNLFAKVFSQEVSIVDSSDRVGVVLKYLHTPGSCKELLRYSVRISYVMFSTRSINSWRTGKLFRLSIVSRHLGSEVRLLFSFIDGIIWQTMIKLKIASVIFACCRLFVFSLQQLPEQFSFCTNMSSFECTME